MTGVIDRYAVISEHLHYNPSFDSDGDDVRVSRQERAASVHARDGYLDILSSSDPEAERERSETRMAEETIRTSEIVFETGGNGTDKAGDFKFEPGGEDLNYSPGNGTSRRSPKVTKEKPIDLRTGTESSACLSCCSSGCRCRTAAVVVVLLCAIIAVVVLIVVGVISF